MINLAMLVTSTIGLDIFASLSFEPRSTQNAVSLTMGAILNERVEGDFRHLSLASFGCVLQHQNGTQKL